MTWTCAACGDPPILADVFGLVDGDKVCAGCCYILDAQLHGPPNTNGCANDNRVGVILVDGEIRFMVPTIVIGWRGDYASHGRIVNGVEEEAVFESLGVFVTGTGGFTIHGTAAHVTMFRDEGERVGLDAWLARWAMPAPSDPPTHDPRLLVLEAEDVVAGVTFNEGAGDVVGDLRRRFVEETLTNIVVERIRSDALNYMARLDEATRDGGAALGRFLKGSGCTSVAVAQASEALRPSDARRP